MLITTKKNCPESTRSELASGFYHAALMSSTEMLKRLIIQAFLSLQIKWEHYISKAGWKMQSTQATESQGRVPVRLKWYGNGTVYVTNFFNFDHEEPARHILWPLR